MPEVTVNYVAVIVAAIANMVLGVVWYGPLFGKLWMKEAGKTKKDLDAAKKDMPKLYAVAFVGAVVTAYVLAIFVSWAQISTIALAIILGFLVWLGFILTISLQSLLWEGKSQKLFLLNNGYNFVSLIVMASIIAAWPV